MSLGGRRRRSPAARATRGGQVGGGSQGRDLSPPREHRRSRVSRRRAPRAAPPRRAQRPSLGGLALQARPAARIAILVAEVVALVVVVSHPAFGARQIDVSGVKHLTREHILDRAGLVAGTSIFSISTSAAESELAADPYVRTVTVRTTLPDRVSVEITEWEALALVSRGNAHYLVNPSGSVLGLSTDPGVGGAGRPRLPITQETDAVLQPGQGAINSRLLTDIDHMQSMFPGAYGLSISRFLLQSGGQLVVETTAGPRILFGQMVTDEQIDSLDAKLAALKSLSGQVDLAHSKLDYITLENPNAPATHTIPSPSPSVAPSPSAHR